MFFILKHVRRISCNLLYLSVSHSAGEGDAMPMQTHLVELNRIILWISGHQAENICIFEARQFVVRITVSNAENIHIIASKPWAFALSSTLFGKILLFSTEDMKLYGINARHSYQWISRFYSRSILLILWGPEEV